MEVVPGLLPALSEVLMRHLLVCLLLAAVPAAGAAPPPLPATLWRYVAKGRIRILEMLTLTSEGPNVVLRIRHFDPKLVAREEKDRAVELPLVAKGPREAVFEGPEYDAKGAVRLTYRRGDDDSLTAVLEKEGTRQEFRLRRR